MAVAVKVVKGMYAGVTTRELDQLAAETCEFFLRPPFSPLPLFPLPSHFWRQKFFPPPPLPLRTFALTARRPPARVCPLPFTRARTYAGAFSSTYHPDWSVLAARIVVSDLHKQTEESFSKNAQKLRDHRHPKTGEPAPLIAEDVNEIIQKNAARLDAAMHYERDFE